MENVVGYGMAGGVLIGAIIIIGRHPIISLIDAISSRLIPEEYTLWRIEVSRNVCENHR